MSEAAFEGGFSEGRELVAELVDVVVVVGGPVVAAGGHAAGGQGAAGRRRAAWGGGPARRRRVEGLVHQVCRALCPVFLWNNGDNFINKKSNTNQGDTEKCVPMTCYFET